MKIQWFACVSCTPGNLSKPLIKPDVSASLLEVNTKSYVKTITFPICFERLRANPKTLIKPMIWTGIYTLYIYQIRKKKMLGGGSSQQTPPHPVLNIFANNVSVFLVSVISR